MRNAQLNKFDYLNPSKFSSNHIGNARSSSGNEVMDYITSLIESITNTRSTVSGSSNKSFSNKDSIGAQLNELSFDSEVQKNINKGIDPQAARNIADFNVNGNKEALDEYLPQKQALKNDPKKLAEYEALVQKVMDKTNMTASDQGFNEYTDFKDVGGQREMDDATKYMVAASIVEMFHNKPELIDKVLDKPGGLNIGMFRMKEGSFAKATFSNNKDNAIILDAQSFWSDAADTGDGHQTGLHEFVHALDAHGPNNRVNGIFESMSPAQQKDFLAARQQLKKQHSNGQGILANIGNAIQRGISFVKNGLGKLVPTDTKGHELSSTGIRDYAFYNDAEFATVTMEMFYDKPALLKQISSALYKSYVGFLGFDPLNGGKSKASSIA